MIRFFREHKSATLNSPQGDGNLKGFLGFLGFFTVSATLNSPQGDGNP